MSEFQKDIAIRNGFFLWTLTVVLLLTAIPLVSEMVGVLAKTPIIWTVPKVYELKFYAIGLIGCLLVSFMGGSKNSFLQHESSRFQVYLLVYYPLSVFIYALPLSSVVRYTSVFILSVLGLGIYIYEISHIKKLKNLKFNFNYNHCLIASVSLAIFIILFASSDPVFSLFSPLLLIPLIGIFLFLQFYHFGNKPIILFAILMVFVATFFTMGGIDVFHYSFFLGPVIEVLNGHYHPFMLDVQYGSGLTAFLALYFKWVVLSLQNMQFLLKVLTCLQYLLIFFIAAYICQSKKVGLLVLLSALVFNFYAASYAYYCCPSIGFLRFGFIYLVLLTYMLEQKLFSNTVACFVASILGSIAFLWSLESAVYTLPAIFFAEYLNRNLKKFVPIFLGCFIVIVLAYVGPIFLQGKMPLWSRYYEYATLYADGFGQVPLKREISFWWLFPLLYGFTLLRVVIKDNANKVVAALTVYGMALFTYYAGRADSNNIFHVAIPFVLLSFYLVSSLTAVSFNSRKVLLALVAVVFLSANTLWLHTGMTLRGIWEDNIPILKNYYKLYFVNPNQSVSVKGEAVEKACSNYFLLKKYIENNSIVLLDGDDYIYQFYVCTNTHNALTIDPYLEIAINPKASVRTLELTKHISNQYLLISKDLLKKQPGVYWGDFPMQILKTFNGKKIGEIKVNDQSIVIFQKK